MMWYGIDFDKTLVDEDGQPIMSMVDKVNVALSEGKDVRIFTARDSKDDDEIKQFCRKFMGEELPITNKKDRNLEEIWDDKAVNPGDTMLQGIGNLQGIMKETTPKKKKKNKFMEAVSKFSAKKQNARKY